MSSEKIDQIKEILKKDDSKKEKITERRLTELEEWKFKAFELKQRVLSLQKQADTLFGMVAAEKDVSAQALRQLAQSSTKTNQVVENEIEQEAESLVNGAIDEEDCVIDRNKKGQLIFRIMTDEEKEMKRRNKLARSPIIIPEKEEPKKPENQKPDEKQTEKLEN